MLLRHVSLSGLLLCALCSPTPAQKSGVGSHENAVQRFCQARDFYFRIAEDRSQKADTPPPFWSMNIEGSLQRGLDGVRLRAHVMMVNGGEERAGDWVLIPATDGRRFCYHRATTGSRWETLSEIPAFLTELEYRLTVNYLLPVPRDANPTFAYEWKSGSDTLNVYNVTANQGKDRYSVSVNKATGDFAHLIYNPDTRNLPYNYVLRVDYHTFNGGAVIVAP